MDMINDYLRSRSAECCHNIFDIMEKGGYFDKVMSLSSEFDRVKHFLHLLRDHSLDDQMHIHDPALPNPRLLPIFPGLENQFTHDASVFPGLNLLEENYHLIKTEALQLDDKLDYMEYGVRLVGTGKWMIHLFSYMGMNISENCQLCPQTTELLNSIPNRCQIYPWGDAIFSVLQPGAHIPSHCSIDNLRVRCMFGIDIPTDCSMRVGSIITHWENGKFLLFEDSFEHEVWHHGDSRRIVLIFDLWHPNLTTGEIELLTIGFSHAKIRELIYNALQNSTEEYNHFLKLAMKKNYRPEKFNDYWHRQQM